MSSKSKRNGDRQVLTANRLREGDVVYLTPAGHWSPALHEALLIDGEEEERQRLDQAEQAVAARQVVGPYLFPVALGDSGPLPVSQRERIRAAHGPTVGSTLSAAAG